MISFANLLIVLLIYLIESLISPSCSYEFNVVYVQWDKYSMFYTTARSEVHTLKNKAKSNHYEETFLFIIFSFLSVLAENFL